MSDQNKPISHTANDDLTGRKLQDYEVVTNCFRLSIRRGQARAAGQTDPRGRIDPSRLDTVFNVECQLPTQEQILGLDRPTRSKGEHQPPKQVCRQIDHYPQNPEHPHIMP